MRLGWEEKAWDEYLYWEKQDKKIFNKINQLVKDIKRNPYSGLGKPEQLKGNLSGWYSRRIDEVNRIIYCEKDGEIIIASCQGHYKFK